MDKEKLEKLMIKIDKIVENINTNYLLKKIEEDEKNKNNYEFYFKETKINYK